MSKNTAKKRTKPSDPKPQQDDAKAPDARAVAMETLREDAARREKLCTQTIQHVLKEYGCDIRALPTITQDGRIATEVRFVARV